MLNRRILRMKAMKALFAYKQSEEANFYLAQDLIHERFEPDLNSMEIPDPVEVEQNRKQARELFKLNFDQHSFSAEGEFPRQVQQAALDAVNFYKNTNKKDRREHGRQLETQTEAIYEIYLLILNLVFRLAEQVEREAEQRRNKPVQLTQIFEFETKLHRNQLIRHLHEHEELHRLWSEYAIEWDDDKIRDFYKVLKKDDAYIRYKELPQASFEEDKEIILYIVREIVFRNEILKAHFEENDLHWKENRKVLRSMVLKTLKVIKEENLMTETELQELSHNWEDDKIFLEDLYASLLDNEEQYAKILAPKIKNWDYERVALTDKMIMEMAISEMINFPSIPVKVTINEYLELAKTYGTGRSKDLINGVLDTLSKELTEKGIIRKSGRGLIDNK